MKFITEDVWYADRIVLLRGTEAAYGLMNGTLDRYAIVTRCVKCVSSVKCVSPASGVLLRTRDLPVLK